MAYDERWLQAIPTEAEFAAYRLRGLSYLCSGWSAYRNEVGDPGPDGEDQVMAFVAWALDTMADRLTLPDPGESPRADPAEGPPTPNTPAELLGEGRPDDGRRP